MANQIRVVCPKCQGTGTYIHFGTCFKCGGQGHFTVSQYTAKERGYMSLEDFYALQSRKEELTKQASIKARQDKIDALVVKTMATINKVTSVIGLAVVADEQEIRELIEKNPVNLWAPDHIATEYLRPFIK